MSIAMRWSHAGGDITLDTTGIVRDDSLYSEIVIRLFTDRRALPGDAIPDGTDDRRGVWSDAYSDGDPMGSRLWLLGREKLLPEIAIRAKAYIEEALATLLTTGRITALDVVTTLQQPRFLHADIALTLPNGSIYKPWPNGLQMELQYAV